MKKVVMTLMGLALFIGGVVFFFEAEGTEVIVSQEEVELDREGVSGYKITYKSEKADIQGLLVKPATIEDKAPLLIHNRGGFGKRSITDEDELEYLSFWAEEGYVVLETEYRENASKSYNPTTSKDFVRDVLDLEKVAKELDYVDHEKIVMLGYSRGGLMTFLTIQQGMNIDAAVVVGAVTDLKEVYEDQSPPVQKALTRVLGAPDEERELYADLSPVNWTKDIDVPVLMVQGDRDTVIPVEGARSFAEELQEHHDFHEYIEVEDGQHSLIFKFREYSPHVLDWFDKHLD